MKNIIRQKTAYALALLLTVTTVFSGGFVLPSFFDMEVHADSLTPYSAVYEKIKSGETITVDILYPGQVLYLEFEPTTAAKYTLKVTSSLNLTYTIEQGSKTKSGVNPELTTAKLSKDKDYTFEVYYLDPSVLYDTCKVKLSKESSSSSSSSSKKKSSSSSSKSSKSSSSSKSGSSSSSSSSSSSKSKSSTAKKGNTYVAKKANYTITGTSTVRYDGAQFGASITEAEVPDTVKLGSNTYNVTAIGSNAFAGYNKLKKVTVGANVKNMHPGAFADASSLSVLNIHSTQLTMKTTKDCLKGSSVKKVMVPLSTIHDYKKIFSKTHSGSTNSVQVRKNNYTPADTQTQAATTQTDTTAQAAATTADTTAQAAATTADTTAPAAAATADTTAPAAATTADTTAPAAATTADTTAPAATTADTTAPAAATTADTTAPAAATTADTTAPAAATTQTGTTTP